MNEATFEFRGKEMHLSSPDAQMLNAGMVRFVSENLCARLKEFIPTPRRILDVGASIGYYTMLFHAIWPEAEIWAIEPSSRSFRYLMANTGHIANVRHVPFAIGDDTSTHSIAMPTMEQKAWQNNRDGNCGIMSLYGEGAFKENVPVVKLDNIIDWCDFIKIDVEGYEIKVINGAERLLKEARPALHVEFVKENLKLAQVSREELVGRIQSFDYVPVAILQQDVIFLPKEKHRAIHR